VLHRALFTRSSREVQRGLPRLPTRVVKGAYRDVVRRAKSFRELKKSGDMFIITTFVVVGLKTSFEEGGLEDGFDHKL